MPYPTSLDGYSLQNMFTGGSEGSWETGYFNPTLNSFLQPDQYNAQLQQAQQQFMQSPEGMAHLWNQLSGDANSKFDQFIAQTGIDAFSAANFAQQAGLMTPQQLASNGTFIAAQQAHARNQSDPSGLGVIGQELTNFGNQINEALPGEIAQTAGSSINQVLEATPSELSTGNRLDPGTYSITNASQGIADNLQNGQAVDPMGVIPSYFGTDPNATPMDYIGNPITATLGGDHLEAGRMAGKIATTMGIGAATGGGGTTSGDGQYGSYDPGGEDMFYEGGSPNFNESTGLYDWETGAGFDPGGEGLYSGDALNPTGDPSGNMPLSVNTPTGGVQVAEGGNTMIDSAPGGGNMTPDAGMDLGDMTQVTPANTMPAPSDIHPLLPAAVTGATGAAINNAANTDENNVNSNTGPGSGGTDPIIDGGPDIDDDDGFWDDFINNNPNLFGGISGLSDLFGNGSNAGFLALGLMEHNAMKDYRNDLTDLMGRAVDRSDPFYANRAAMGDQYMQMNRDPNWMQNDSVLNGIINNSLRNVGSQNAARGYLNSGNIMHDLTRTATETTAPYALQRMEQVGRAAGALGGNPAAAGNVMQNIGSAAAGANLGASGALGFGLAGLAGMFNRPRTSPSSGGGSAPVININPAA